MGMFNKNFNNKNKRSAQPSAQNYASFKTGLHDEKTEEKANENTHGISLLDKHESGYIDDKSFLSSFGKVKVFYSRPFGDHKDGGSRLFVLPAHDETAYLPVFSSIERAMEFYEKAGRVGFAIFEGSFTSFLETTRKINEGNTPIKLGAVIDPGYYGVTIGANLLDTVIEMSQEDSGFD